MSFRPIEIYVFQWTPYVFKLGEEDKVMLDIEERKEVQEAKGGERAHWGKTKNREKVPETIQRQL